MIPTPTLEARLAKLLPQCTWAMDCASYAQKTGRTDLTPCSPCRDRAAILALIREREREMKERCAEVALRRVAPDSPDHVAADCTECHDGLMLARDIRALGSNIED